MGRRTTTSVRPSTVVAGYVGGSAVRAHASRPVAAVSFPRRRKVFPRQDQSHNLSNFRLVISSAVIVDADDAPRESKSIKSDAHEENFATLLAAF